MKQDHPLKIRVYLWWWWWWWSQFFFLRNTLKRRVSGRRLEASCRQGDVEVKWSNEKYSDFVLRATDFMQLKRNKS